MYLVNELAKNYFKSLFFNFLMFFVVIGAHLGGYHGNKFEFFFKYFCKIWNFFQNTTKKLVTV